MSHVRLVLPLIALSLPALAGCAQNGPAAPTDVSSTAPAVAPAAGVSASLTPTEAGGRRAAGGVIYVTGQGLYFDTFVVKDPLPMEGPFQPLYPTGGISETPYGPGDPGYLGGRWWVDVNGNMEQDSGDHFFLCPLFGPGRETP